MIDGGSPDVSAGQSPATAPAKRTVLKASSTTVDQNVRDRQIEIRGGERVEGRPPWELRFAAGRRVYHGMEGEWEGEQFRVSQTRPFYASPDPEIAEPYAHQHDEAGSKPKLIELVALRDIRVFDQDAELTPAEARELLTIANPKYSADIFLKQSLIAEAETRGEKIKAGFLADPEKLGFDGNQYGVGPQIKKGGLIMSLYDPTSFRVERIKELPLKPPSYPKP